MVRVYVGVPVAALLVISGKPVIVGRMRQLRRIFVILLPAVLPVAFMREQIWSAGAERIDTIYAVASLRKVLNEKAPLVVTDRLSDQLFCNTTVPVNPDAVPPIEYPIIEHVGPINPVGQLHVKLHGTTRLHVPPFKQGEARHRSTSFIWSCIEVVLPLYEPVASWTAVIVIVPISCIVTVLPEILAMAGLLLVNTVAPLLSEVNANVNGVVE